MSRLNRRHGLDVLRVAAALAVVALHAGLPYMTHPLPGLRWCLSAEPTSPLVDALCWGLNLWVMPAFFLLSGWLAADMLQRMPLRDFVRQRTARLLTPLIVIGLPVLTADLYIWLCGWVMEGRITPRKVQSLKLTPELSAELWGVAHLWFLQCLWGLSMAACLLARALDRWRAGRRLAPGAPAAPTAPPATLPFRAGTTSPVDRCRNTGLSGVQRAATILHPARGPGLLLAAMLTGAILWTGPEILIGFRQAWTPSLGACLFYSVFFAAGWTWPDEAPPAAPEAAVARRTLHPGVRLLAASAVFPMLLRGLHQHVDSPLAGAELLWLTCGFTLAGWLAATGLFSWGLSARLAAPPAGVRFFAAASFWVYLVHHPLAALAQLALSGSSLPAFARFCAVLAIAVMLSLTSYAVLVRNTWLGAVLEGRRTPPGDVRLSPTAAAAPEAESAVAASAPRRRAA